MVTYGSKYRGTQEFLLTYCLLIRAAKNHQTIEYMEVARILGIETPGHHMAKQVGQVLGEISEDEHEAGRPMLSAVATKSSGEPGPGFFELARRLGKLENPSGDSGKEFWNREVEKVFNTWSNR